MSKLKSHNLCSCGSFLLNNINIKKIIAKFLVLWYYNIAKVIRKREVFMNNDTTVLFDISEVNEKLVYETLSELFELLEERGYNPVNQIVGYLMSGDLGYISSYKECRTKIAKLERSTILEVLLKDYLTK